MIKIRSERKKYEDLFKKLGEKVMKDEFESISPTAILTSYPRIFTDIPYEKEIYNWIEENCSEKPQLNKNLAPEIEARYKLINKILDNTNIKQVLELASGYSSRGIIYSQKGYNYIEMDLENVATNKRKIVENISKLNGKLEILSGNALNIEAFDNANKYFEEGKIAVINEGLLRYLTFDEKEIVARNIYSLLKKHNGGVWITCDVTPKKFILSQDKALPNFNKNLTSLTDRNSLNDRFENIEHIKEFFGKIGFDVIEIHKFIEVKKELYSINHFNIINENIEKSLEDAIVAVMKIK